MSVAGDHHYVPQFHLRNWEGDDKQITEWSRVPYSGRLTRRRVAVAGTAYVRGLYSLEHVSPAEVQKIETEVFGQIETKAALALTDRNIVFIITDLPTDALLKAADAVRDRGTVWFNAGSIDDRLREEDCRVNVMVTDNFDPFATTPRPPVRTTEDYLRERDEAARKGES